MRKHQALRQKVIEAIRARREELGLSQRELSRKLKEHETYIYEIERGQHSVRTEELIVLAEDGLDMDALDLLAEIRPRRRSKKS